MIEIQHVELSINPSDEAIYVVSIDEPLFTDDAGARGMRVEIMPTEIFETRAAEYDIDASKPGGWDDLFDLVFASKDAPAPEVDVVDNLDHLYTAPTIEHARKARLNSIRGNRARGLVRGVSGFSGGAGVLGAARAVDNSGDEDPVEFIKRTAPMSKAHIRVKQEFVRRQRNLVRVQRLGRRANELVDMDAVTDQVKRDMKLVPARESAEALAARLLGQPSAEVPEKRRTFAMERDENDIARNRLPPREGPPSKQL